MSTDIPILKRDVASQSLTELININKSISLLQGSFSNLKVSPDDSKEDSKKPTKEEEDFDKALKQLKDAFREGKEEKRAWRGFLRSSSDKQKEDKKGLRKDISKGFAQGSKTIFQETSKVLLGPMNLITEPLKELTGFDLIESLSNRDKKKGKGLFGTGKEYRGPLTYKALKGIDPGAAALLLQNDEFTKKEAKTGGLLDKLKNMFGVGAVAGFTRGASAALMKGLGIASIAGSILWGVMDGINQAGNADGWGVSTAAAFMGGFLSGRGEGWEGALKNSGKGALLGGGIGMMVGGPIGMIVGGLLGGALAGIAGFLGPEKMAGSVQSAMDYLKDNPAQMGMLAGAGIGAIGGFLALGPVGAIVGALLGGSIGTLISHVAGENVDMSAALAMALKDPRVSMLGGAALGGLAGMAFGPVGIIAGALLGAAMGGILGDIASQKMIKNSMDKQLSNADVQRVLSSDHANSDRALDSKTGKKYSEIMRTFDAYVDQFELWKTDQDQFTSLSEEAQEAIKKRFVSKISNYDNELNKVADEIISSSLASDDFKVSFGRGRAQIYGLAGPSDNMEAVDRASSSIKTEAQAAYDLFKKAKFSVIKKISPDRVASYEMSNGDVLSEEDFKKLFAQKYPYMDMDDTYRVGGANSRFSPRHDGRQLKFHSGGISPDETYALLRKDEEVLSPARSREYRDLMTRTDLEIKKDMNELTKKRNADVSSSNREIVSGIKELIKAVKETGGTVVPISTTRFAPDFLLSGQGGL